MYNLFKKFFLIFNINTHPICGIIFFSKYENDPELREKYENSLYIMGMLRHTYFKELSYFAEKNPMINLEPLENITDLMLKVDI